MLAPLEIPEIRNALVPMSLTNYETLCKQDPENYKNTELFRGMVLEKMTKSSEHNYYKNIFTEEIRKFIPSGYFLQNENSLQIQDSELEPDISVIEGNLKDFKHKKPKTAKLVVEIALSSLVYDRNKALDYCIASVDEYWIVDVVQECVEVHKEPGSDGYKTVNVYKKTDTLSIFSGKIDLAKVFE